MDFVPLASSSKGNCYLIKTERKQCLLLEAGLPIAAIRDKLREYGVSLSDLSGVLISHEHTDHSKAVKDLLRAGIDCWMSEGTARVLNVAGHYRTHTVLASDYSERISGAWIIKAFDLEHDATEPKGFLISQNEDRLLFIPDTAYVQNRFEGVTTIAVECNHIAELLSKNILEGHIPQVVGCRVRRNHMSLENLIEILKTNYLSKCRQIFLMHLSSGNSIEEEMRKQIQQATGIPVYICEE